MDLLGIVMILGGGLILWVVLVPFYLKQLRLSSDRVHSTLSNHDAEDLTDIIGYCGIVLQSNKYHKLTLYAERESGTTTKVTMTSAGISFKEDA